jgi:hypothetical protein
MLPARGWHSQERIYGGLNEDIVHFHKVSCGQLRRFAFLCVENLGGELVVTFDGLRRASLWCVIPKPGAHPISASLFRRRRRPDGLALPVRVDRDPQCIHRGTARHESLLADDVSVSARRPQKRQAFFIFSFTHLLIDLFAYLLYSGLMQKQPILVTQRALLQRIGRKLAQYQMIRTARGRRAEQDLGRYYVLDVNRNFVVEHHVNLEELGRRLEALAPWEELEAEPV